MIFLLVLDASFLADPVQVRLCPGESSRVANLTSSRGSKGDNSDLLPLLAGSLDLSLHVEGAMPPAESEGLPQPVQVTSSSSSAVSPAEGRQEGMMKLLNSIGLGSSMRAISLERS